eukprot:361555-Rhodomonas_salina.1
MTFPVRLQTTATVRAIACDLEHGSASGEAAVTFTVASAPELQLELVISANASSPSTSRQTLRLALASSLQIDARRVLCTDASPGRPSRSRLRAAAALARGGGGSQAEGVGSDAAGRGRLAAPRAKRIPGLIFASIYAGGRDPIYAGWDPIFSGSDPFYAGADPIYASVDPIDAGRAAICAGLFGCEGAYAILTRMLTSAGMSRRGVGTDSGLFCTDNADSSPFCTGTC